MIRRNRRTASAVILFAVLGFMLGACGDDDEEESTATTEAPTATTAQPGGTAAVDVVMSDYAYAVSGPLLAGGTINISNTGQEFHMMGMGKLKDGKTLEDFRTALLESGPPGGGEGGGEGEGGGAGAGAGGATTTTSGGRSTTTASGGRSTTTTSGSRSATTTTRRSGSATTTTAAGGGEDEEGEGERPDPTAEVVDEVGAPAGIMGPAQSVSVTVPDLGAGTYALVCFIPTEGPEGAPHFTRGMIGELEVTPEKAPEPTADATYTVALDETIEGPATLTPGRHVLKIEASGDSAEDLEPALVLPESGRTIRDMDRVLDTFEESIPVNAAEQVPGELIYTFFDLGPARTVYLAAEFKAGTYQLTAEDSDADPQDFRETITIRVG